MAAANDSPVLLPGVEQLEATPGILRVMMETISEDDANWKPAPGRFSTTMAPPSLSSSACRRAGVSFVAAPAATALSPPLAIINSLKPRQRQTFFRARTFICPQHRTRTERLETRKCFAFSAFFAVKLPP